MHYCITIVQLRKGTRYSLGMHRNQDTSDALRELLQYTVRDTVLTRQRVRVSFKLGVWGLREGDRQPGADALTTNLRHVGPRQSCASLSAEHLACWTWSLLLAYTLAPLLDHSFYTDTALRLKNTKFQSNQIICIFPLNIIGISKLYFSKNT